MRQSEEKGRKGSERPFAASKAVKAFAFLYKRPFTKTKAVYDQSRYKSEMKLISSKNNKFDIVILATLNFFFNLQKLCFSGKHF